MGYLRTALIAITAPLLIPGKAQAIVVASHMAGNDPTTEGWVIESSFAPSGRPTSGTVLNDQGSGFDAWYIDDNLSTIGSNLPYNVTLSDAQNVQAATHGWTLRANVRIADIPDSVGNAGSIMLSYANGSTDFRLALGSENDGDPIALLWDGGTTDSGTLATGSTFALQGGGPGYHLYELMYDPFTSTVDLFIDGIERLSNYAGVPTTLLNRVSWGSGSSFDTGQSNWNKVEMDIVAVPLPASLPFFLTGLVYFGWLHRARRPA
jgi:hypothetical protein